MASAGNSAEGATVTTVPTPVTLPGQSYAFDLSESVSLKLNAPGVTSPSGWTLKGGALPPGLTLSSGGLLSGTPSATGLYNSTLGVSGASGAGGTDAVQVAVHPALALAATPVQAEVGRPLSEQLLAQGGAGDNSFSATGSLPAGLALSPSGLLSGSPTAAGYSQVSVTVGDAAGTTTTISLPVTVYNALSIAGGPSVVNVSPGEVSSVPDFAYAAGGGSPTTTTFSVGGSLPPGFSFSGNVLYANLATAPLGTWTITLYVQDGLGGAASEQVVINNEASVSNCYTNSGPDGTATVCSQGAPSNMTTPSAYGPLP